MASDTRTLDFQVSRPVARWFLAGVDARELAADVTLTMSETSAVSLAEDDWALWLRRALQQERHFRWMLTQCATEGGKSAYRTFLQQAKEAGNAILQAAREQQLGCWMDGCGKGKCPNIARQVEQQADRSGLTGPQAVRLFDRQSLCANSLGKDWWRKRLLESVRGMEQERTDNESTTVTTV